MSHNRYINITQEATGTPYRAGNQITILQNGDEIFPAMLAAIRGAETQIEFLTYVFWRSRIASEVEQALCERARAGIKVRLLLDAIGAATMDTRSLWRLERAGVQVAWFRPVRWPHLHKFNNRTHRKILLVDGAVGFTGGVGIADEWTGSAQDRHHWRETHCRIEGPACLDLYAGFAENWREATRQRLPELPTPLDRGSVAVHTTISSTRSRPTQIEKLLDVVFAAAEHRLWITSAYFIPSPKIVEALAAAARRGVDVRVLTNGPFTDYKITLFAARATYQPLLDSGVKIYEYQHTMHHSKIITADSMWATLGSTNLDNRSLVLNDELNISVTDPGTITTLDLQFLEDLKKSHYIRSSVWPQRNWIARLPEIGSSLFWRQL
ncbi:MAG: Cardiolipin synthase [Patescibacteria group bacterium]|nr:Cardiolipin synthase [Patescibacteria group bacterium]